MISLGERPRAATRTSPIFIDDEVIGFGFPASPCAAPSTYFILFIMPNWMGCFVEVAESAPAVSLNITSAPL
jgi:hypothetical protein